MQTRFVIFLSATASLFFLPSVLVAQFQVQRIASGLNQPLYLTSAPGDDERLFVVEKGGEIEVYNRSTGTFNATPFLDVPVSTNSERGLLGLAFHPDYQANGLFYVNLTNTSGNTEIRQYQVSSDPNVADQASATPVLSFSQPFANHNGGWQGFGPDGFLYIATGDGGSGNDPQNNGQDITDNRLGKLLRIDVNGDDFAADPNRNYAIPADNPFVGVTGDDEIWSYGLRNPWRVSFDRETGDLYIGDVGQDTREEINVQLASSSGGQNYGWRLREGTIATPGGVGGAKPPGAIDPIYDYSHGSGALQGNSVTGGYVYRGPVSELYGQYIFADYTSNNIWSLEFDGSDPSTHNGTNYTNFVNRTASFRPDVGNIASIASFGEDNQGNLYLVDIGGGEIFQLMPFELEAIQLSGGGGIYAQNFDEALGTDGSVTGTSFPTGWFSVFGEGGFGDATTEPFPIGVGFGTNATLNAGAENDADRTLAVGRAGTEGLLQLLADVTDADATSLQLRFDVEAWDARQLEGIPVMLADDPGEAAFNVTVEVDSGDGFAPLFDFGTVTTGAVLALPDGEYIDGNVDPNHVSFDSGVQAATLSAGSTLRVRWAIDTDAQSQGWVFGLDNVMLSLSAGGPVTGDFNGDGLLNVSDVDSLVGEIVAGTNDPLFDITEDGTVDKADLTEWLSVGAEQNGFAAAYLPGDSDLDGSVDPGDLNNLALSWRQDVARWSAGDFTADGSVNATDLNDLALNWRQSIPAAAADSPAVPEPSSLLLIVMGLAAVCRGFNRR